MREHGVTEKAGSSGGCLVAGCARGGRTALVLVLMGCCWVGCSLVGCSRSPGNPAKSPSDAESSTETRPVAADPAADLDLGLLEQLESDKAEVRHAAVRHFLLRPDPGAAAGLARNLEDDEIAYEAAAALARLQPSPVVARVAAATLSSPAPRARAISIDLLREAEGLGGAVRQVSWMAENDPEEQVRRVAVEAMAASGISPEDRRTVAAAALADGSAIVRVAGAELLTMLAPDAALPLSLRVLADEEVQVREVASALILEQLVSDRSVDVEGLGLQARLTALAETPADPRAGQAASLLDRARRWH